MLRLTFLGTAAARPTVSRNVSGLAVQREGDVMLFDCGEGTQRQMMRYQTGFALQGVFVTHLHADHFLGISGLFRTLALQGRTEPLPVFAPRGTRSTLETVALLGVERVGFPYEIVELTPGDRVEREGYDVVAFGVDHGTSAVGYALEEHERLGRFDLVRAVELGVPEGPLFGRLHRGETIQVDGRTIRPEDVVGPSRRGRKLVYTGDTAPSPSVVDAARHCDVLVHEATFGEDDAERARETAHSTAAQAARIARDAGAGRLLLTHLSARYADQPETLEAEARRVFPEARVARDGLVVEIPLPPDGEPA